MIARITGTLVHKSPTEIVVDNQGIGFQIHIPVSTFEKLGQPGDQVALFTYLHVREDALLLYGFVTEEERRLFRLLISVSGVGPKLAQGVLSGISTDLFEQAIHQGDVGTLNRIPGIGKKTAERLVLELKDKVGEGRISTQPGAGILPAGDEVIKALISLGYRQTDAEKTVRQLILDNQSADVETLLRLALRSM